MKKIVLFLVLFCSPFYAYSTTQSLTLLEEMETSFITLSEKLLPTVVAISPLSSEKLSNIPEQQNEDSPHGKKPFHDDKDFRGSGSGIIMSKDGYIVTNNHVVGNQKYLEVKLYNDKKFTAGVVGIDADTDIAVLKIDPKGVDLQVAQFESNQEARIGQWVVAIGHPYGFEKTVTFGRVTGIGREGVNLSRYENYIQTDASINPGNSGGPLFNLQGHVLGINTAILNYAQGIGFAIPSNMASLIYSQLVTNGTVIRGWLGVGIQELTGELAEKFGVEERSGVLINEVFDDNPAANAGMMSGDIITKVNKTNVATPDSLSRMIAEVKPNEEVQLDILRNGQPQVITTTLAQRKTEFIALPFIKQQIEKLPITGVTLEDMTPESAKKFDFIVSSGVVVAKVEKDSAAENAGLRSGDVIIEAEKDKIETLDFLKNKISLLEKEHNTILLRILRENRFYYLVVPFK